MMGFRLKIFTFPWMTLLLFLLITMHYSQVMAGSSLNDYVTASQNSFIIDAEGADTSVLILSNTVWDTSSVTPANDWIIITSTGPYSGDDYLFFSITTNLNSSARQGQIVVSSLSRSASDTITIIQKGQDQFYLILSPTLINIDDTGGDTSVSVASNTTWSATALQGWITITDPVNGTGSGDYTVSLTVAQNSGQTARQGSIVFTGTNVPNDTIRIIQDPAPSNYLIVSPVNIFPDPGGSNDTVQVSTSLNSWAVSSGEPWITLITPSNQSYFIVSTDANNTGDTRTGTVTVQNASYPSLTRQVSVIQGPLGEDYVIVSAETEVAAADGDTIHAGISSNITNLEVVEMISWITIINQNLPDSFDIAVSINNTGEIRSGIITVQETGNPSLSDEITITQPPVGEPYIIGSPDPLITSGDEGSGIVQLSSNECWSTEKLNGNWFTVTPDNGCGDKTLVLDHQQNPNTYVRQGSLILIVDDEVRDTVQVIQNPTPVQYFLLQFEKIDFPAIPNEPILVDVESNIDWIVKESGNFFTVDPPSGSGNSILTISAEENTTNQTRTALLVMGESSTELLNDTIIVTQPSQVDPDILPSIVYREIAVEGDTFRVDVFTIPAALSWTAEVPSIFSNWLSIELIDDNGTGFYVYCDENLNPERRTGYIEVSSGDIEKQVNVLQFGTGDFYLIAPGIITVSDVDESAEIEITSNVDWEITIPTPTWIDSFDPLSGSGNGLVKLYFSQNPSTLREDTIILNSDDNALVTEVLIRQLANSEKIRIAGTVIDFGTGNGIEDTEITFFSATETRSAFTDAEGEYQVVLTKGWPGPGGGYAYAFKESYSFEPERYNYIEAITTDLTDQDFIASLGGLQVYFEEDTIGICDSLQLFPTVIGGGLNTTYKWHSEPPGFSSTDKNPLVYRDGPTTYYVEVTDGVYLAGAMIFVEPLPQPEVKAIAGATDVCRNQAGLTYSVENPVIGETYYWSISTPGPAIISGQGTSLVTVNWGDIPGPYQITLTTANEYGCSIKQPLAVTVNDANSPGQTGITYKTVGSILICLDTHPYHYQWGYTSKTTMIDGLFEGKTERYCQVPDFKPQENYYWVDTWYEGGEDCKSRSFYRDSPVLIDEHDPERNLHLYPNPCYDQVNIYMAFPEKGSGVITLSSTFGVVMQTHTFSKKEESMVLILNTDAIDAGIYYITLEMKEIQLTRKLIIYR
jgi:hypothetical protein